MSRHAYLIMAHNQFDFLEMLLRDLDFEDNDVYLHVDKKQILLMKSILN